MCVAASRPEEPDPVVLMHFHDLREVLWRGWADTPKKSDTSWLISLVRDFSPLL